MLRGFFSGADYDIFRGREISKMPGIFKLIFVIFRQAASVVFDHLPLLFVVEKNF